MSALAVEALLTGVLSSKGVLAACACVMAGAGSAVPSACLRVSGLSRLLTVSLPLPRCPVRNAHLPEGTWFSAEKTGSVALPLARCARHRQAGVLL